MKTVLSLAVIAAMLAALGMAFAYAIDQEFADVPRETIERV